MHILLDTANIEDIKKAYDLYPIDGVTTNPTIIVKEKTTFISLLKQIRAVIGTEKMLHVQAVATTAKGIIEEAEYLRNEIDDNLYIKIPVIPEGIKAMKYLSKKANITATAIFTPQQALLAAKSGAHYLAPYVNRLDNISAHGIGTVQEIAKVIEVHSLDSKILAASFKNVEQVHNACLVGAHAITTSFEIIESLLYHPLTNSSVSEFINNWEAFYGKGKKTNNI